MHNHFIFISGVDSFFLKSIDNPPRILPKAAPYCKIMLIFPKIGKLKFSNVRTNKIPIKTKSNPMIFPIPNPLDLGISIL